MCYIIARDCRKRGCFAFRTNHGEELANHVEYLEDEFVKDNLEIEIVTLSRPSAYGEYEPYTFVDTKEEFTEKVKELCK